MSKPEKPDKSAKLADLLGSDSTDFLAGQLTAAWCLQSHEERKRRRHAVIYLSQELGRIQNTTEFSTRLAELAIESVIEGDWKMVQEWADHFTFDTEGNELREKYAPVFATFRELLLQTLRTDKELPA